MKTIAVGLIFVAILSSPSIGNGIEQKYQARVQNFINSIKNNDRDEVAKLIGFPNTILKRKYPLPSIDATKDFMQHYDEIFDEKFKNIIINSNLDTDWNYRGWEGISLGNGLLWLNEDGTIWSINYESEIEKNRRLELIEAEKKRLHDSLRSFKEPILEWKTKKYHIRIDKIDRWNFRYAVWSVKKSPEETPDLVLNDGEYVPDGSGGNLHYDFVNGAYKYSCYVTNLGTGEEPPGLLSVYKNDQLILEEPVESILISHDNWKMVSEKR